VKVPDDDVARLLQTLYDRNFEYHHVKERVVWFAGTIYLTFSALLIAWYVNSDNISLRCSSQKHFAAAFLSLIFVFTAAFIIRQTREKVHATVITEQYLELIGSFSYRRHHAELKGAYEYKFGFWDFIGRGWSGLLILGVVCSFFAAQLVVLYGFPKTRLWLPIAIVLVVLCIPFPIIVANWKKIKRCLRNLVKRLDP
jgi:hypothetical protein